jgi:hypothetical protein
MTRRLPSPALTIAILALVLAATGSAVAAHRYLITSKHQIAPRVRRQLRGAQGPAGQPGPAGPIGSAGPQGAPGVSGWEVVRVEDQPTPDWAELEATCPDGKKVLGGGAAAKGGTEWPLIKRTAPNATGTGWLAVKTASLGPSSLSVYAICAYVN